MLITQICDFQTSLVLIGLYLLNCSLRPNTTNSHERKCDSSIIVNHGSITTIFLFLLTKQTAHDKYANELNKSSVSNFFSRLVNLKRRKKTQKKMRLNIENFKNANCQPIKSKELAIKTEMNMKANGRRQ